MFLTLSFEHGFLSLKKGMRIKDIERKIKEVIKDGPNKTCAEQPLKNWSV